MVSWLFAIAFVAACSSGPRGPGRDAWQQARTVAERYLSAKYGDGKWEIDREFTGTPFMFHVRAPDAFAVLVHDGEVVTQRGLPALDRYLRQSRSIEDRTTTEKDFEALVQLLEALPSYPNPRSWIGHHDRDPQLHPRLDYHDAGRATFTLHYTWRSGEPSDHDASEPDADSPVTIVEWTLTMDPGAMPVWRMRRRDYNPETKHFVDHPK